MLSLLQVPFQSSSTKKAVWGLIHLYFIFMDCIGIKHFEFYIGYEKAKVSSWESALKITKDFMWDCLRSFYLLFLTVFKYLLSIWNAFACHSQKSVVETSRAAGHTPQGDTWGEKHSDFWRSPKLALYLCQQPTFVKRCQCGLEKPWATFLREGREFRVMSTSPSKTLLRAGWGDGFTSQSRRVTVLSRNSGYWAELTVQWLQWSLHIQIHGAYSEVPGLGALAIAAHVNNVCI